MRKIKFNARTLSEINVTPMVDVMLVLLIIFMVSAPYLYQGITIKLPKTTPQKDEIQKGKTIAIDKNKNIYYQGEKVSIETLEERLNKIAGEMEPEPVFIRADAELPYGDVIELMDMIKQTGIETIGMVTEPKSKK
jgi:biopolymer transport protein TolR